jgi:hypothetical protein
LPSSSAPWRWPTLSGAHRACMASCSSWGSMFRNGPLHTSCPVARSRPSQTWRTFLQNHVSDLVSVEFFVVPTATFRVLYVFVVLLHHRRQIVHFNITDSPTSAQQIVEAFPDDERPRDRAEGGTPASSSAQLPPLLPQLAYALGARERRARAAHRRATRTRPGRCAASSRRTPSPLRPPPGAVTVVQHRRSRRRRDWNGIRARARNLRTGPTAHAGLRSDASCGCRLGNRIDGADLTFMWSTAVGSSFDQGQHATNRVHATCLQLRKRVLAQISAVELSSVSARPRRNAQLVRRLGAVGMRRRSPRSTTFSPRQYAATAAPISLRSSSCARTSPRTPSLVATRPKQRAT